MVLYNWYSLENCWIPFFNLVNNWFGKTYAAFPNWWHQTTILQKKWGFVSLLRVHLPQPLPTACLRRTEWTSVANGNVAPKEPAPCSGFFQSSAVQANSLVVSYRNVPWRNKPIFLRKSKAKGESCSFPLSTLSSMSCHLKVAQESGQGEEPRLPSEGTEERQKDIVLELLN